MSGKVTGLNDKAFELALRLYEEYRSRQERLGQYNQEQYVESDSRVMPLAPDLSQKDVDVISLDDILSTFDDEKKRQEFDAFVGILPIMVKERHGLCTGLDNRTIEEILTKEVSSKDVASYVAGNLGGEIKDFVVRVSASVAGAVSRAASVAKQYVSSVWHGSLPAVHQVRVVQEGDVACSPTDLTLMSANAEVGIGACTVMGALGYSFYVKAVMDSYPDTFDYSDPSKALAVYFIGAILAGEGLVRHVIAEKVGEPCGSSFGVLVSIPACAKSWYLEKKREVALRCLKIRDEEGNLLLGE